MMRRRNFIRLGLFLPVIVWSSSCALRTQERASDDGQKVTRGQIMTVTGPIPPEQLGLTLPHEHVLVDFVGADQVSPGRYDRDKVFERALPYLLQAKELGCRTLIECTPAYLGRDPALLKRLSEASGLQLLTNTGYYGAGDGKYLPPHAHTETAAQLATRWGREWREGIDGTGIRPGFIKISVNKSPLGEVDQKLVHAAALTHLQSGLTIASHTGSGAAALEELAILQREGVTGNAFIWVHAQSEKDGNFHFRAARQGAWLSFDGISPASLTGHLAHLQALKKEGLLGQVLISHDAGWYHVGEPGGGNYRSYETLFQEFVPALKAAGFTETEIRQLTIDNPQKAFMIRVRK